MNSCRGTHDHVRLRSYFLFCRQTIFSKTVCPSLRVGWLRERAAFDSLGEILSVNGKQMIPLLPASIFAVSRCADPAQCNKAQIDNQTNL